ncbi:DUF4157 domain-containing protein [Streptomyces sp. RK31]|uniref:eCIS core domain-containing protein n=1 Tax=Streptomyces sp. RK31 TaxID=2824892 RepID=UPI001B37D869|nr:DUF4157 domain-containing protein [Streptomyces sp. RK31]MBQ0975727.1 DUF4157 domain-containing protein [Streptomyces sp. RK31]
MHHRSQSGKPVQPAARDAEAARPCACGHAPVGGACRCSGGAAYDRQVTVRRSAVGTPTATAAPAGVHDALRSPATPVPPAIRSGAERALGGDFSNVRVHSGDAAARSARALGARAYTVGRDIVMGAAAAAAPPPEVHRLLMHELAHVRQDGAEYRGGPLRIGDVGDHEEAAADAAAAGSAGRGGPAASTTRRAPDGGAVLRRRPVEPTTDEEADLAVSTVLDALYQPQLSDDPLVLIAEAAQLQSRFGEVRHPLTRTVAARKLLMIRGVLGRLAAKAARDASGALESPDFYGAMRRWTGNGARSVQEIPPFLPDQVQEWQAWLLETGAAAAPEPGGTPRPHGQGAATPGPAPEADPFARPEPVTEVGGLGVVQPTTAGEGAADTSAGGAEIHRGLAQLGKVDYASAVRAVAALSDGEGGSGTMRPDPRNVPSGTLLDFTGQVWFVSDRLYPVDRTGHLAAEEAGYDISAISLAPGGTYFFGKFALRTEGAGSSLPVRLLLRIDGAAPRLAAGGNVYAGGVNRTFAPLSAELSRLLGEGAGVGIVVSSRYGTPQPQLQWENVGRAFRKAPDHADWAVRVRAAEALENPTGEMERQAVAYLMGELIALLPDVGAMALVLQLVTGTTWLAETARTAAYARTEDEVDLAAQEIARVFANLAVDHLIQTGIAKSKGGYRRSGPEKRGGKPPAPAPGERHPEPRPREAEPGAGGGKKKPAEPDEHATPGRARPKEEIRLPESLRGCRVGSLYCSLEGLYERPEFREHMERRQEYDEYLGPMSGEELVIGRGRSGVRNVPTGKAAYIRYLREVPREEWSQPFTEAVARAEAPGARAGVDYRVLELGGGRQGRWPLDELGSPWQVHHEPPFEFGGRDEPAFLKPVPYRMHFELGRWWGELKEMIKGELSPAEWRELTRGEDDHDLGDL